MDTLSLSEISSSSKDWLLSRFTQTEVESALEAIAPEFTTIFNAVSSLRAGLEKIDDRVGTLGEHKKRRSIADYIRDVNKSIADLGKVGYSEEWVISFASGAEGARAIGVLCRMAREEQAVTGGA